jgi:hypothetical protein
LSSIQRHRYFGNVVSVNGLQHTTTFNIDIQFFNDSTVDSYEYPSPDVERLATSNESSDHYPATFIVGDVVDAFFQDGKVNGKWFRGRVVGVDKDGGTCNIFYYDGDVSDAIKGDLSFLLALAIFLCDFSHAVSQYESSIPMREKKIRLVQRCDASDGWVTGKKALLPRDGDGGRFKTGIISKTSAGDYQVKFRDGSNESISYEEAAKTVFCHLLKNLPLVKQLVWPVSTTASMADTIRLRMQRKEQKKLMDEFSQSIADAHAKPPSKSMCRARPSRSVASKVAIKAEPGDETVDTPDEIDDTWLNDDDADFSDLYIPLQGGPSVDISVLEKRKIAKEFPPGLPNVLWCGLNSPEAQTASNFLWDLLCVHDMVPPSTMIQKLMDLMKYGPKAEGSSLYFKDPHRTELAAQFVYGLLGASNRLVRRDSGALFGPSSWDDVEVLLGQSVAETENMISGRRLSQGLQLAAR